MRKLVFILLFLPFLGWGQISWTPAGAEWCYCGYVSAGWHSGYTTVKYESDTIINSFACQKLQKTHFRYDHISYTWDHYDDGYEITCVNDSVVYLYEDNQLDTLYDFKAVPGDQWRIAGYDSTFAGLCDSSSSITVVDTGMESINGYDLKWLDVRRLYIGNGIYNDSTIYRVYERIGSPFYLLPFDNCFGSIDGNEGGRLCQYRDSSFGVYSTNSFGVCDTIMGINERYNSPVRSTPNPTTSSLNIQFPNHNQNPFELSIFDNLGKLIYRREGISEGQLSLDVSAYPSGIYHYQLLNPKSRQKSFGKFVKQ